jgi:hypothetical protein
MCRRRKDVNILTAGRVVVNPTHDTYHQQHRIHIAVRVAMVGSRTLLAALALVTVPLAAHTQTCLGLAPFSAGRVQLAAIGEFGNDARAYTGTLTFGSVASAFGGVSVGTISYDALSGGTTTVGVSVGLQIPIGTGARVQMCPGLGVVFGFGPDNIGGSGADLSSRAEFLGVQVGVSAGSSPRLRIVPTAGAAFAHTKVDVEGGMFSGLDESDVYGVFTLGFGLVMSSLSIQPGVDFTAGLEDNDPTFTVVVAVNFGGRR